MALVSIRFGQRSFFMLEHDRQHFRRAKMEINRSGVEEDAFLGDIDRAEADVGNCAGQTGECGTDIPEMVRTRWLRSCERNICRDRRPRWNDCGIGEEP
jgi:hypothetical protein